MGVPAFDRIAHHASRAHRAALALFVFPATSSLVDSAVIWGTFVLGLVGFAALLFPLTQPSIYDSLYWR